MDEISTNKIGKISSSLDELTSRITTIGTSIKDLEEDFFVHEIEQDCIRLMDGIINFNLNLPSLHMFERHLYKINKESDVIYIASLFTEIWKLTYGAFFDKRLKEDESVVIERVLSRYPEGKSVEPSDINDFSSVHIMHSNQLQKNPKEVEAYKYYIEKLNLMFNDYCKKNFDFTISENFSPISIPISSNLSIDQLKAVFDIISQEGLVSGSKEVKEDFLALFKETFYQRESQIKWLQYNSKNKGDSYSHLYTLFESLGVDMTIENKKKICFHFIDNSGNKITHDKLKNRETAKSKDLSKKIREVIEAP